MTLDIMPWYLGFEEGTDLDEPELYWINVHNTSLSKLFEEKKGISNVFIETDFTNFLFKFQHPQKLKKYQSFFGNSIFFDKAVRTK